MAAHVYYRYNKPLSYLIEIIVGFFFMMRELCWFKYRILNYNYYYELWASGIYCGRVEQAAPLAHWASG